VLASTVTLALVLVACGAGSEPSSLAAGDSVTTVAADITPAPSADVATTVEVGATSETDGPDATVSPGLPTELVGSVGPIEVIGENLPPLTDPDADPAIGALAPVIVGQSFDGETVRIDAAANGPTLVVFLAHWCPHCNAEIPRINELRDANRFPAELNIVGISTAMTSGRDNFPPGEWLDRLDWSYPAIADGIDFEREVLIAAEAFGVNGFPFVTLIDSEGSVAARWSGEREPDEFIELITSGLLTISG
jgi:cytochrome c biogenesis protein CcmG/thiol:disulfide interchange protein DsbE